MKRIKRFMVFVSFFDPISVIFKKNGGYTGLPPGSALYSRYRVFRINYIWGRNVSDKE